MKTFIISAGLMLLPSMALAGAGCRVVEYPDHDEAVCTGDAPQASATSRLPEEYLEAIKRQTAIKEQAAAEEQAMKSARAAGGEQSEDGPIIDASIMGSTNRMYWAQWARSRQGQ